MKKSNKVLIIIICVLLGCGATAALVCHFIMPISTRLFFENVWETLNKPLPIVGISTLMILVFAWRIFANSSLGKKKINDFKREVADVEKEFEEYKAYTEEIIAGLKELIEKQKEELEENKEFIGQVIQLIPNKKVKALGDKFYGGKEKIDD